MPTGKVKFYREDERYGLIAPDDGGKAVFVHITSVADTSVEVFREDRRVRYVERVSQRSGNPEAFDVVVL
jgi:cold shock CspA family protein